MGLFSCQIWPSLVKWVETVTYQLHCPTNLKWYQNSGMRHDIWVGLPTLATVYIKMKSGTEQQGLILACLYPFSPSLPLPSCSDLPFLFPLFPSILPLDSFNSKSYLVPQILYAALMTRSARNSSCHLLISALEAAGNVTFGSCLGDLGIKILDS